METEDISDNSTEKALELSSHTTTQPTNTAILLELRGVLKKKTSNEDQPVDDASETVLNDQVTSDHTTVKTKPQNDGPLVVTFADEKKNNDAQASSNSNKDADDASNLNVEGGPIQVCTNTQTHTQKTFQPDYIYIIVTLCFVFRPAWEKLPSVALSRS